MSTPEMRVQAKMERVPPRGERKPGTLRRQATLRLLAAERSVEIYPVLLEEIVALGFPRGLTLGIDFETGEVAPSAALNCTRKFQQQFRTSLYAAEDPIVGVVHSEEPAVLPGIGAEGHSLYVHPIVYRNRNLCWEADRDHRTDCLAIENYRRTRKLQLQDQVCSICDMRAYAAVVLVDLTGNETERDMMDLRALIEIANRYLSRIF